MPWSPGRSSTAPTRIQTPAALDGLPARRAVTTRMPEPTTLVRGESNMPDVTGCRLVSSLWVPVDSSDHVQNGLRRMMEARAAAVAGGERPAGWKIGWNAPAVRERLGAGSSVIGFLLESGIRPADEPVPLEGATKPGAEVELGLRIGERGTLAAVGPAIELIDVHGDFFDVEAALAANVWNRGAVLGEAQDWSPAMLDEGRGGGE